MSTSHAKRRRKMRCSADYKNAHYDHYGVNYPIAGSNRMLDERLDRTRLDLAEFLKKKRENISPTSVGLPQTGRRRTPGLRREEVAALAGVGLTWYTWLEQGRHINVSSHVLDRISDILNLDDVERRHLFMLAHKRPPVAAAETTYQIPSIVRTLLDDLSLRPAYVFNLRWDVLAWNCAAQRLFDFDGRPKSELNMLWMLFGDQILSDRIRDWEEQAPLFVASFRRDFAQASNDREMVELVAALEEISPLFRSLWRSQSVQGRCQGRRSFEMGGIGFVEFDHSTLIVNADEHVRLALYAAKDMAATNRIFVNICNDEAIRISPDRTSRSCPLHFTTD
jgi:transcriptional regulator with XRE-family HTH domain